MERDESLPAQADRIEEEAARTNPPQPAEETAGPADALPAWRPFYAAVRDAMRKLREE